MYMGCGPETCTYVEFLQAKQYLNISELPYLHCWATYAIVFYLVSIYYSHTLCHLLL